jgi:predicted amidohydrolase YtcJ
VKFPCLENQFSSSCYTFQTDLDSDPVIRGRSVVLQSKDGHALWVSSKVIMDSQPLPDMVEGGVIIHDEYGYPTGEFIY